MDTTDEHSSLYSIGSGLDFEIDPSPNQNYYDPSFEIFSNSVIGEVEPSGAIDPIFLQSDEVFSNYDEDSVQEFVEGFGEVSECSATSSFTVPPTDIPTQSLQVIHYSDNYPLPNYFAAPPVKGSSVQTSLANNADSMDNKENQENFTIPSITTDTTNESHNYYIETNSQDSHHSSMTSLKKKQRYGGPRTPYRCGKCGQAKKGHKCSNSDGEPRRKASKKRSFATSNTSSPASSEPHTPITPTFQDNSYGIDYRSIIQQHNSRTANNTITENGAMSPLSPLPNSPAPAFFEIPQTRLTPITQSLVITPKTKTLKTSSMSTIRSVIPRVQPQTVVMARKANQ